MTLRKRVPHSMLYGFRSALFIPEIVIPMEIRVIENIFVDKSVKISEYICMTDHTALIDALGGGTKLAETLEERTGQKIDRERVYKWKVNGVPWRWRNTVAALAKKEGVKLPPDFFSVEPTSGVAAE